jgi:hypothetical protein
MGMPLPKRYPIIVDELQTQARILRAAAELTDGRYQQARTQRKIADLMLRAAMHIIETTNAQEKHVEG